MYTGVRFNKAKQKWESSIFANRTSYFLGYFNIENDAANEYDNALEYYDEYSNLINYPFRFIRKKITSFIDTNQLIIDFSLN